MQYMLLIYSEQGRWESLSDDERDAIYADYMAFGQELTRRNA